METESNIRRARSILRNLQHMIGKKRSRLHENVMADTANRLRALDGLCGGCSRLEFEFDRFDGKERVELSCIAGKSPVVLYTHTELGEKAKCDAFVKRE